MTPPERNSRPSTSWIDARLATVATVAVSEDVSEIQPMTDVQRMHQSLLDDQHFAEADIHILAPSGRTARLPTRQNIVQELQWLTTGLQAGDELFFYYAGETLPPPTAANPHLHPPWQQQRHRLAGHRCRQQGRSQHGVPVGTARVQPQAAAGQRRGGVGGLMRVSESPPPSAPALPVTHAILPCDSRTSGLVSSEQLQQLLISPLPAGVELICLLDASHSDGLVKLPYIGQPTYINGMEYYKTGVYKDLERTKVCQRSCPPFPSARKPHCKHASCPRRVSFQVPHPQSHPLPPRVNPLPACQGACPPHVFVMSASAGRIHHLASSDPALGTAHRFLALTEAYIQATHTLTQQAGGFDQGHLLTAVGAVMQNWACAVATEAVMHTTHRGLELPGQELVPSVSPAGNATDRDGNSSDECGTDGDFPRAGAQRQQRRQRAGAEQRHAARR
ncbi:MAG: hypothetical protein WDW38_001594 [Sanguina aurantia]